MIGSSQCYYDWYGFRINRNTQMQMQYTLNSAEQRELQNTWQEIIPNISIMKINKKHKLKKIIRSGVPDKYRQKIWPQLINAPLKSFEMYADKSQLKEIDLDLFRTFPTNKYQEQIALKMKIVLNALASAVPKVGYCQGMNFIVGTLLLKLNPKDAFGMAFHILHQCKHEQLLCDLSGIHHKSAILSSLIQKHFPKLHQTLLSFKITPLIYCSSWFITLFCSTLPPIYTLRILELYVSEGEKIIYRVALQILRRKKKILKKLNFAEQIIQQIKNCDQFFYIDIDSFFKDMFKISLSKRQLIESSKTEDSCDDKR